MKDEALLPSESSATPNPPISSDISSAVEVGRRLCAAREALRLSQAELASRLRLGERQVVALETGNLGALPGKTFARGFVRNYALAVALDPQPLLSMLEQAPELAAPALNFPKPIRVNMPPQGQMAQKRDRLIILLGVFLLLIAIAVYFFAPQHLELKLASTPSESITALPLEYETLVLEQNPLELAAEDSQTLPEAVAASPAPSATSVAQGVSNNLRLDFQGESWVEVIGANEQKLHSRVHSANSSHELKVTPPVSIIIGRASSVSLYYQGKLVPLQPNSNDVAQVKLQ